MDDDKVTRERIEARFEAGWPATLSVPDVWLPHLGTLDVALAAVDPGYLLNQVKEKWGGLRYYLAEPAPLACCERWDVAHPWNPEMTEPEESTWELQSLAHDQTGPHTVATAAAQATREQMGELITAAEHASYRW